MTINEKLHTYAADAVTSIVRRVLLESAPLGVMQPTLLREQTENLTRLLRLVYAQGQRDAMDVMTAAVKPIPQTESP